MKMAGFQQLLLLQITISITTITAVNYEWTPWTLCTLGCGGGTRSRMCKENAKAATTLCTPPNIPEIEKCKKEKCSSSIGSTSPITVPPIKSTQKHTKSIDKWDDNKNCVCGCKLTKERGKFRMTFGKGALCTWEIFADKDYIVKLTINTLENFDWKNGAFYVAHSNELNRFTRHKGENFIRKLPMTFNANSAINFTIQSTKVKDSDKDIVFEFQYYSHPDYRIPPKDRPTDDTNPSKQGASAILIGSITACVAVIIILLAIFVYHKIRQHRQRKDVIDQDDDGVEDSCSSIVGSSRSARHAKLTSPRKERNASQNKILTQKNNVPLLSSCENNRLIMNNINNQPRGYPDGREVFMPGQDPNMVATFIHNGQPYINWPMNPQTMLPHQQQHINYPKQMSFEKITQPPNNVPVYYNKSGGEG